KLAPGAARARFDGAGAQLAVQRSDRAIVVYEWPGLSVAMRIEYMDRVVRGIAFGSNDWLGIGPDHGDGNQIDVVTSATHRTDTRPGRQHRSWRLLVEAKRERMQGAPPSVKPEAPKLASSSRGRIGIGAGLSIALLCIRLIARLASTSSPDYS